MQPLPFSYLSTKDKSNRSFFNSIGVELSSKEIQRLKSKRLGKRKQRNGVKVFGLARPERKSVLRSNLGKLN